MKYMLYNNMWKVTLYVQKDYLYIPFDIEGQLMSEHLASDLLTYKYTISGTYSMLR